MNQIEPILHENQPFSSKKPPFLEDIIDFWIKINHFYTEIWIVSDRNKPFLGPKYSQLYFLASEIWFFL